MRLGTYNRKLGIWSDWGVAVLSFVAAVLLLLLFLDTSETSKNRWKVAVASGSVFLVSGVYFYRILASDPTTQRSRRRPHQPAPDMDATVSRPIVTRQLKPPMHRSRPRRPPGA